jgi:hypothetical protein
MRRRWLIAGAGVLVAMALGWATVRFTGGTLSAAFWYVLWHTNLQLKSIPQDAFWVLLLCLSAALAVASLVGRRTTRRVEDESPAPSKRLVRPLAHSVHRAGEAYYFRWRLARQLSALIVEAVDIAGQSGTGSKRQWWIKNSQNVPPEIRAYVDAALWGGFLRSTQTMPLWRRALSSGQARFPIDLDLETVVRFLEEQVEGEDEHRQA